MATEWPVYGLIGNMLVGTTDVRQMTRDLCAKTRELHYTQHAVQTHG